MTNNIFKLLISISISAIDLISFNCLSSNNVGGLDECLSVNGKINRGNIESKNSDQYSDKQDRVNLATTLRFSDLDQTTKLTATIACSINPLDILKECCQESQNDIVHTEISLFLHKLFLIPDKKIALSFKFNARWLASDEYRKDKLESLLAHLYHIKNMYPNIIISSLDLMALPLDEYYDLDDDEIYKVSYKTPEYYLKFMKSSIFKNVSTIILPVIDEQVATALRESFSNLKKIYAATLPLLKNRRSEVLRAGRIIGELQNLKYMIFNPPLSQENYISIPEFLNGLSENRGTLLEGLSLPLPYPGMLYLLLKQFPNLKKLKVLTSLQYSLNDPYKFHSENCLDYVQRSFRNARVEELSIGPHEFVCGILNALNRRCRRLTILQIVHLEWMYDGKITDFPKEISLSVDLTPYNSQAMVDFINYETKINIKYRYKPVIQLPSATNGKQYKKLSPHSKLHINSVCMNVKRNIYKNILELMSQNSTTLRLFGESIIEKDFMEQLIRNIKMNKISYKYFELALNNYELSNSTLIQHAHKIFKYMPQLKTFDLNLETKSSEHSESAINNIYRNFDNLFKLLSKNLNSIKINLGECTSSPNFSLEPVKLLKIILSNLNRSVNYKVQKISFVVRYPPDDTEKIDKMKILYDLFARLTSNAFRVKCPILFEIVHGCAI